MQDAIESALRNAPQVREYDAVLDGAKARSSTALRAVLPSGEIFGSHAQAFRGAAPALNSPASRMNQAGVSVAVPVFYPQGWVRRKSALESQVAARYEWIDHRTALAYSAASAWVEYVGIVHRLELARSRTNASRRSFEGVGVRTAAGDLTRIDLRQAESALFSARADEAILRGDSVAAAESVFLLCGGYPAAEADFPDSLLTLPLVGSDSLPEASDVAAARMIHESAASTEQAELFGWFPAIHLSGSTAYSIEDVPSSRQWEHRAELRVAIPIPPVTGTVGAARAARRIAESRYVAASRNSASRYRTTVNGYSQSQLALSLYLSDSAAAADVAIGRETAFQAGSVTISEFLSAQRDLYSACDKLWLARRNLALAGLALLSARGAWTGEPGLGGKK